MGEARILRGRVANFAARGRAFFRRFGSRILRALLPKEPDLVGGVLAYGL